MSTDLIHLATTKITPDILVTAGAGGDSTGGLVAVLLSRLLQEKSPNGTEPKQS